MYLVQWLRAHAGKGPGSGSERSARSSARAEAGAPTAATATTEASRYNHRRGQPSSRHHVSDADQCIGQAVGMGVFGVWEPRDLLAHAKQVGGREAVGSYVGKAAQEDSAHLPSCVRSGSGRHPASASLGIMADVLAGRVSTYPTAGSRSCRQRWRRSGGQESTRRPLELELSEQHRSRRPEPCCVPRARDLCSGVPKIPRCNFDFGKTMGLKSN